jgi:hypothetical protein
LQCFQQQVAEQKVRKVIQGKRVLETFTDGLACVESSARIVDQDI